MFDSQTFGTRGGGLNVGEDEKVCSSGESMSAYKALEDGGRTKSMSNQTTRSWRTIGVCWRFSEPRRGIPIHRDIRGIIEPSGSCTYITVSKIRTSYRSWVTDQDGGRRQYGIETIIHDASGRHA